MNKYNKYLTISVRSGVDYQMVKYTLLLIFIFSLTFFVEKEYLLLILLLARIFTVIYLWYTVKRLNRNYRLWSLLGFISPVLTSFIIAFIGFNFDYNKIAEHVREARSFYKNELTALLKNEKNNLTEKKIKLLDEHNHKLTMSLIPILYAHGIYEEKESNDEDSKLMMAIGSIFLSKNYKNLDNVTFRLKKERIGNLISSMAMLIIIVVLLAIYY